MKCRKKKKESKFDLRCENNGSGSTNIVKLKDVNY